MTTIRQSAVAGQFYPADPEELRTEIDTYLRNAEADMPEMPGKPRMLVLPHAGYVFSGRVAAYGFAALEGHRYDTAVVVAVSHRASFDAIHVYDGEGYATPLGTVAIDLGKVAQLKKFSTRFENVAAAESGEHSVEVMVPFLQQALGGSFTLVPIILSGDNEGDIEILAAALEGIVDENTIVIASSDLTHYPSYQDSVIADDRTVEAIMSGNPDTLASTIREMEGENISNIDTFACGELAIRTIMTLAHSLDINSVTTLNMANSGDVDEGSEDRVVGYAAVAFSKEPTGVDLTDTEVEHADIGFTGDEVLSADARREALGIAYATLNSFVEDGAEPNFEPASTELYVPLGAFVTLLKNGGLRGCIGLFETDEPLWKVLRDMTVAAASEDNRFDPVTAAELEDITIEISVLSPMKRILDPLTEIEIGRHGVYVKKNGRAGTYLPQVATDNNWDLETFMDSLCGQKAGIGSDSWKDGTAEVYTYTAQVFGE